MPELPILSGREIILVLERIGFEHVRQRGSHVMLRRHLETGSRACVVPLHREVALGTLRSILRQAGISPDEFIAAWR
jgi:predicted RNA binding protein YcfA (HicA-like mRNA interferase family)